MKIKPTKQDGIETVTLYGKTVDVTGKDRITLFKRDYEIVRPKVKKEKMSSKSPESKHKKTDVDE